MPGDLVQTITAEGDRIAARIVEGPHQDGDFLVVTLCSPEDWTTVQAGGTVDDYWDEWRYDWPVEAIEEVIERG